MDKIWDRKSFEVGGHCCGWDIKKTIDHAKPNKNKTIFSNSDNWYHIKIYICKKEV